MQKSFLSQIVGHHVKYEFTRDLDSVMPMGPISIPQNPVQLSQPPLMPAMRPPFMNNPQPRMPMVTHREPMGCTTSRPMVNPMRQSYKIPFSLKIRRFLGGNFVQNLSLLIFCMTSFISF